MSTNSEVHVLMPIRVRVWLDANEDGTSAMSCVLPSVQPPLRVTSTILLVWEQRVLLLSRR